MEESQCSQGLLLPGGDSQRDSELSTEGWQMGSLPEKGSGFRDKLNSQKQLLEGERVIASRLEMVNGYDL